MADAVPQPAHPDETEGCIAYRRTPEYCVARAVINCKCEHHRARTHEINNSSFDAFCLLIDFSALMSEGGEAQDALNFSQLNKLKPKRYDSRQTPFLSNLVLGM